MTDLSWFEDYGDKNFQGFDMSALKMDEAYLQINIPKDPSMYTIYKRHVDCYKCPYVKLDHLSPESTIFHGLKVILRQIPNIEYRISDNKTDRLNLNDDYLCTFGKKFGEFGVYSLTNVTKTKEECEIQIEKNSVSIAFPVLTVILIYCALFLCAFLSIFIWKKFVRKSDNKKEKKETMKRLKSLDAFRGISIVIMIFANYGGGEYYSLDHVAWNGLHLADVVFPWFMWIMGVCIPISLMSNFKKQLSNKYIFLKVLKRSIKLFCLGIFLGAGPTLGCFRISGVLQRFGFCYFVVATICLFLMKRDLRTKPMHKIGKHFRDLINMSKAWIVVLIILFVYYLIVFFVTDEGCPRGYLGPGGLHDGGNYFNCTGGATGYIDRLILGKHMSGPYPPSKTIYHETQSFEGLLGYLILIFHVFIGVQAGVILLTYKKHSQRLIRWLSWSVIIGLIGAGLCGFSKEDGIIPVNKKLWSISFVFVTCCFALILLSICYVLIDVKNWWSGKPFLYAGMNAILIYIGHEIGNRHLPVRWTIFCDKGHGTHFIALFENLWGTFFWLIVSYYLYKIKYFFSV